MSSSVAKKNRDRGKRVEKRVAKEFGGDRIGIFGGTDVIVKKKYSIEVKSRLRCVADTFMEQSVRNCRDGTIPIVILHITGRRSDDDLLMVRMKDIDTFVEAWEKDHGSV